MNALKETAGLVMIVGFTLAYFWFVSLPIAMLATPAFVWLQRHRPITDGAHLASHLCLFFPLGMLFFGGAFPGLIGDNITVGHWAVVYGPILLLIGAYVYAIFRAQGQRLATSAVAALGLWLSLCASFVAVGSLTGQSL